MFILVEALSFHRWTDTVAAFLAALIGNTTSAVFVVGGVTLLGCNLVRRWSEQRAAIDARRPPQLNNQPTTILLTRVLASSSFVVGPLHRRAALFALALMSNYACVA